MKKILLLVISFCILFSTGLFSISAYNIGKKLETRIDKKLELFYQEIDKRDLNSQLRIYKKLKTKVNLLKNKYKTGLKSELTNYVYNEVEKKYTYVFEEYLTEKRKQDLDNNKIENILEDISYGNLKAYIQLKNEKSYLYLIKDGKKILKKEMNCSRKLSNNSSCFYGLEFIDDGNVLKYNQEVVNVFYNINNNKSFTSYKLSNYGITKGKKYFYICGESGMLSGDLKIFNYPNFSLYKDLELDKGEVLISECNGYNKNKNTIKYELQGKYRYEYNLDNGKTIITNDSKWKRYNELDFSFGYPAKYKINKNSGGALISIYGDFDKDTEFYNFGLKVYEETTKFNTFIDYADYIEQLKKEEFKKDPSFTFLFKKKNIGGFNVLIQEGDSHSIKGTPYIMYVFIGNGKIIKFYTEFNNNKDKSFINEIYYSLKNNRGLKIKNEYKELIKNYYYAISNGKLEEAYLMKYNPSTKLEGFKNIYKSNKQDVYVYRFKNIEKNKISFIVDFYDRKNNKINRYNTIMEIMPNNKLKTISTKKIEKEILEDIFYGELGAYIEWNKGKSRLYLKKDGKKILIDEVEYGGLYNIGTGCNFDLIKDLEFIDNGAILKYSICHNQNFYILEKDKNINLGGELSLYGFSKNKSSFSKDRYFYVCGIDDKFGSNKFEIYDTKTWKVYKTLTNNNYKLLNNNDITITGCDKYDWSNNDLILSSLGGKEYLYNFYSGKIVISNGDKFKIYDGKDFSFEYPAKYKLKEDLKLKLISIYGDYDKEKETNSFLVNIYRENTKFKTFNEYADYIEKREKEKMGNISLNIFFNRKNIGGLDVLIQTGPLLLKNTPPYIMYVFMNDGTILKFIANIINYGGSSNINSGYINSVRKIYNSIKKK